MKIFTLMASGIFVAQAAFAQLPTLQVENFSASYNSPEGHARADVFVYEQTDFGSPVDFEFYQQAGEFVLSSSEEEFRVGGLPQEVYDWKSVELERVDISSSADKFTFDSKRIDYVTHEGERGSISQVQLDCESAGKSDVADSFLQLCLNQKMYFYIPFISAAPVDNINIWANKNVLRFSLKNGVWIKGDGAIFYDEDQKLVRIRIDKAKAGFLNVTGKLFAELKKLEGETMTVKRPWIEIPIP